MSFGFVHRTVRVIHPRAILLIEDGFYFIKDLHDISSIYPKIHLYLLNQNIRPRQFLTLLKYCP